jgi:hypothetical protein
MPRAKSLGTSAPGSVDELRALRRIAIAQLGKASPREASPLLTQIQRLGGQIRIMEDAAAKMAEGPARDEPLDPATL